MYDFGCQVPFRSQLARCYCELVFGMIVAEMVHHVVTLSFNLATAYRTLHLSLLTRIYGPLQAIGCLLPQRGNSGNRLGKDISVSSAEGMPDGCEPPERWAFLLRLAVSTLTTVSCYLPQVLGELRRDFRLLFGFNEVFEVEFQPSLVMF